MDNAAAPRPSTKFTRTCSLLRRFIKERGTIGIDIQMTAPVKHHQQQPVAAMVEAKSRHSDTGHASSSPVILPDLNGSGGSTVSPSLSPAQQPRILSSTAAVCKPSACPQAPSPQMTIFYAGKVFVFDNFPLDKARQFMAAAAAARGVSAPAMASTNSNIQNQSCAAAAAPPQASTVVAAGTDVNKPPMAVIVYDVKGLPQPPPPHIPILASGSDLPIARRVSLNRFLEKRKDRITSKAPYQVAGSLDPMASSKPHHQPSTSADSPSPSLRPTGDTSAAPSSFPPPPPHQHGALLPDITIDGGGKIYTEPAVTAPAPPANDNEEEPSSSSAVPWLGLAPPPSKPPL